MALEARRASEQIAPCGSEQKNRALLAAADKIGQNRLALQEANEQDLRSARAQGLPSAFLDRLTLSDKVITQMCRSLEEVAALPDPVGEVVRMWRRPNGLWVGKMRIPLGVIGMRHDLRGPAQSDRRGRGSVREIG